MNRSNNLSLHRAISLIRKMSFRLISAWRIILIRASSQSPYIPFSTSIGKDVGINVTDGGALVFGENVSVGANTRKTVRGGSCSIGRNVELGPGCIIACQERISIGDDVLIAEYVTIRDQDHKFDDGVGKSGSGFTTAPILIGANVWLGAKVTVTKGVSIGENSVIGANSVVTRDIPANVLAVGVPARVIRSIERDSSSSHTSF